MQKANGAILGKPENLTTAARLKETASTRRRAAESPNNRRAASLVAMMGRDGKNYSEIARERNGAGFQTARGSQFGRKPVKRLTERNFQP